MFSFQDFSKHNKISYEAIKRILKGCRFVFFNKKMTKPSATVPGNNGISQKHRINGHNKTQSEQNNQPSAYKMGEFRIFMLVFIDVERIKLFKICKCFFSHLAILTHHRILNRLARSLRRVLVESQLMQASVSETPYFNCDRSSVIF